MHDDKTPSKATMALAAVAAAGALFTGCSDDGEIPAEEQQERNVPPGLREEGDPRDEEN